MGIIRPSLVSPQEIIHIKASLIIYGSRIALNIHNSEPRLPAAVSGTWYEPVFCFLSLTQMHLFGGTYFILRTFVGEN